jgi:signal transduction histidine kinase
MIAHDLRSALTVIGGYLALLKMQPSGLKDDQMRFIEKAGAGVANLVEMISSLLDVNRFESGEMPLNKEFCDMRAVAQEAIQSIESLAIGRKVLYEAGDTPIDAFCDRGIMKRVVSNLLGNALKFTPEAGTVRVTVVRRSGKPRVEVKDTGYGIPPEYHGKIFDKFGQVEVRKENKTHSSGLGLTFCKLAIETHDGWIGVVSEVGKGSTFWFELPN